MSLTKAQGSNIVIGNPEIRERSVGIWFCHVIQEDPMLTIHASTTLDSGSNRSQAQPLSTKSRYLEHL